MTKLKDGSFPFWTKNDKGKVVFSALKMSEYLTLFGWGWYQFVPNRGARRDLFHNDDGVVKLHSEVTIKKWLLDFLESVDENEFVKGFYQIPSCALHVLSPRLQLNLDAVLSKTTAMTKPPVIQQLLTAPPRPTPSPFDR